MLKIIKNNIYLLLMAFMFLFWIILQVVKPYSMTTGDTGAMFLLSDSLSKSFSIFPTNYYYPTEFRLLWTSTFYAPLMMFIDDFNTVRIIGNIILYSIIMLAYIYIFKILNINYKYAYLALFLFFIPISNHYMYISMFNSFYLTFYFSYLLIIGLFFHQIRTEKKSYLLLFIYVLFIFYISLNSIRTLLFFLLPAFASSVLLLLIQIIYKKYNYKYVYSYIFYSFISVISSILAYIFQHNVLKRYAYVYNYIYHANISENLLNFNFNNIKTMINQIFSIYYWDNIISIASNISLIIFILISLYIVFYLLYTNKTLPIQFILYFVLISIVEQIILIIFVNDLYSARYFYISYIFIPIIIALYINYKHTNFKNKIINYILVISLFIHGVCVIYNTYTDNPRAKLSTYIYVLEDNEITSFNNIINYLLDKKITYGYGYHDPAHIIYELSNGKIEAGSIMFLSDCNITYMKWDTLHKYYDNNNLDRKSFFIVDKNYYNKCKDKHKFFIENTADKEIDKYLIFISSKGRILDYFK